MNIKNLKNAFLLPLILLIGSLNGETHSDLTLETFQEIFSQDSIGEDLDIDLSFLNTTEVKNAKEFAKFCAEEKTFSQIFKTRNIIHANTSKGKAHIAAYNINGNEIVVMTMLSGEYTNKQVIVLNGVPIGKSDLYTKHSDHIVHYYQDSTITSYNRLQIIEFK